MSRSDVVAKRFAELQTQMDQLRKEPSASGYSFHNPEQWQAWATSALNLLESAFGRDSIHFGNFSKIYEKDRLSRVDSAKGVFRAAKADFEGGYVFSLTRHVSGEIFGDFVLLAREAFNNGNHHVAAVLACAALEDALKRYATSKGLDVAEKDMQQVVNALKSKGLVSGSQKTLLDAMPKIRDHAMHANWEKITPTEANGVIAFVEAFLLMHFA